MVAVISQGLFTETWGLIESNGYSCLRSKYLFSSMHLETVHKHAIVL